LPHRNIVMKKFFLLMCILLSVSGICVNAQNSHSSDTSAVIREIDALLDQADAIKENNIDSSSLLARRAMQMAEDIGYETGYARASVFYASVLILKAEHVESMELLNNAVGIFRKHKDFSGLIKAYSGIGLIYTGISEYSKAIEFQMQALRLAEYLNDSSQIAVLLNNIATIHIYQGEYDEALEKLLRSIEIFNRTGQKSRTGISLVNIGIIFSVKGEYEKANQYYLLALKMGEMYQIPNVTQIAYTNMAHLNVHLGQLEEALTNYNNALEIQQRIDIKGPMSASLKGLGDIYRKKGNNTLAIQYYNQALQISETHDLYYISRDVYEAMAEVCEETGDLLSAILYLKKYQEAQEKLSQMQIQKQTELIETKYKLEKMQAEVGLLNIKAQLDTEKIRQQRIFINILVFGIFSFLTMLIMIFYQKRKKDTAYERLVIKHLESMKSQGVAFQKQLIAPEKITDFTELELSDPDPDQQQVKYEKSNLSDEQKAILLKKIIELIEGNKMYLKQDISLDMVSREMQTYKNHISQVINELTGKNFMSFINEYRIREAQLLLIQEEFDNYTIEAIAQMSGFQSKASFNAAFKKITGLTPSYFKTTTRKNIL
jgi:AraC-like DNA-binding protein